MQAAKEASTTWGTWHKPELDEELVLVLDPVEELELEPVLVLVDVALEVAVAVAARVHTHTPQSQPHTNCATPDFTLRRHTRQHLDTVLRLA